MKQMFAIALLLLTARSFAVPAGYLLEVETRVHRTPYSVSVFATNPLYETLDCLIIAHGLTQNNEVITKKSEVAIKVGSYNFANIGAKNGDLFVDAKGEAYCRFFN